MKKIFSLVVLLLAAAAVVAQNAAPLQSANAGTVRGCLRGERGNYIVIEDGSSAVYVLKGVGNKLDRYRRHEVEVKGKILPGLVKTGVRPEKEGSNPSDTVHGIDGTPLQVENVDTDIHLVSKQCKAADQQ